jgi:tripartite-type tricarboxylate transporter receptor subunit TctC
MITQLGVVVALSVAMQVGAQEYPTKHHKYPTKPVRILAPSAGTSADSFARAIGTELSKKWGGTSVIIDNRGGRPAARMPASKAAEATPDGYTLFMGETSSLAAAISLFSKLEYDPISDFAPITLVARAPFVLLVNSSLPVKYFPQFIE